MATRKEEKERLRAARLEAEQREAQAARKRLILGYGVAGVLTAAVLVGIVIVIASGGGGSSEDTPAAAHIDTATGSINGVAPDAREGTPPPAVENLDLENAAADAGCTCGSACRTKETRTWSRTPSPPTTAPTRRPRATTSPPRSMQADGAYEQTPELIEFVHSLEHGRIEIQYAPDLPEADQLALKGVFDESPSGMLLFPNPRMPYEVAATAWTQLMGCKRTRGRRRWTRSATSATSSAAAAPRPVPFTP